MLKGKLDFCPILCEIKCCILNLRRWLMTVILVKEPLIFKMIMVPLTSDDDVGETFLDLHDLGHGGGLCLRRRRNTGGSVILSQHCGIKIEWWAHFARYCPHHIVLNNY